MVPTPWARRGGVEGAARRAPGWRGVDCCHAARCRLLVGETDQHREDGLAPAEEAPLEVVSSGREEGDERVARVLHRLLTLVEVLERHRLCRLVPLGQGLPDGERVEVQAGHHRRRHRPDHKLLVEPALERLQLAIAVRLPQLCRLQGRDALL